MRLLNQFRDIFHVDGKKLTFTNKAKHKIKLKNDSPIYTKPYRYPNTLKEEVNKQFVDLENQSIHGHPPCGSYRKSPALVVRKNGVSW